VGSGCAGRAVLAKRDVTVNEKKSQERNADELLCARFRSRYQAEGGGGGNAHFDGLCTLVAGLFRAMVRFTALVLSARRLQLLWSSWVALAPWHFGPVNSCEVPAGPPHAGRAVHGCTSGGLGLNKCC
jgi:hypothetical protein